MDDPTLRIRLQEVIAALDRRLPRPDRASEPAIARDAALLRAAAVQRLEALRASAASSAESHAAGRRVTERT